MKRIILIHIIFLIVFIAGCSGNSRKVGVLNNSTFEMRLEENNPVVPGKLFNLIESGTKIRLSDKVLFTKSDLKNSIIKDNVLSGKKVLYLIFTKEGAKKLALVTKNNIGLKLAFVIDGVVWIAARIQTEISGGEAVVTGIRMQELLNKLVNRMKR